MSEKTTRWQRAQRSFEAHAPVYWGHLSHFNNLLILLNVSLFFLTGLVERGYYYTFISIGCLAVVGVGLLLPVVRVERLTHYLWFLALELVGLYFLASSIVFWVRHGSMRMPFS
jgi:hypothetical protein